MFQFLQTDAQAFEGLVIVSILGFLLILGFIVVSIDNASMESDLRNKLNRKKSIITKDDVDKSYKIDNKYLGKRIREIYNQQQEEKENRDLKNKAFAFENSELNDADIKLRRCFDKIENQTKKCNKCGGGYMRIWFLSESLLEVRCENCKKKFKYLQKELNDVRLVTLIDKLNRNNERHNASHDNSFIRKSEIKFDFNGHKANSPEWYYYTISPKSEATIGRGKIKKENYRSRRISQEVMDAVWNRDGGKCIQCGSNENLEFDHIIPHSRGGANTYRNIQLLCESCNRSKSDKIG